ncbi:MAG: MerR family transcriptional regulator [Chlamydiota bacterium]
MSETRIKRGKAFFSISAVSKMFSVHQQTVRLYEKEGLIQPKRSDGNTRMFSEEDIEKLEEIIHLTHQLGINLAGVEMILQLQKKMKKMQTDMNKMFATTQHELTAETHNRKILIKNYSQQLQSKKTVVTPNVVTPEFTEDKAAPKQSNPSFKDWDIDYEE